MAEYIETDFCNTLPDRIYLCQVNETVSCAACCGLYNVADPSREALSGMLEDRTDAFENVSRQMDSILAFGEHIDQTELQDRPLPEFHSCPFIGLIGPKRSRVGCMLHPAFESNHGIDYRGLSIYGGMACRVYFCPSCNQLPSRVKSIILRVVNNWHLYGLVVTEEILLNAFFGELERRIGRQVTDQDCLNDRFLESIEKFLRLKTDWPFRPLSGPGLCNYFFNDRRYMKPPVVYGGQCQAHSRFHRIFRELISSFDSAATLIKAEGRIENIFSHIAGVNT